jgi:methyl coenzyme M reductase alpha subunit
MAATGCREALNPGKPAAGILCWYICWYYYFHYQTSMALSP